MSKRETYKWVSFKKIQKHEPLIVAQEVSEVARGPDGFLSEYKKHKYAHIMKNKKVPDENITWKQKRDAFIDRTLPAYMKEPTLRRYLSLLVWAYKPTLTPNLSKEYPELI